MYIVVVVVVVVVVFSNLWQSLCWPDRGLCMLPKTTEGYSFLPGEFRLSAGCNTFPDDRRGIANDCRKKKKKTKKHLRFS